jgi:probable DNA repair protein
MGTNSGVEVDAWLRGGGLMVTASDRATRALSAAFHRARQAEGLTAWPAPRILDWKTFARSEWGQRIGSTGDGRLLLNPTQEQALWTDIAGRDGQLATLLPGPRHRLAGMAMEAHDLLAAYAPKYLRTTARTGWQQDAGAFSGWLASFDETCRDNSLLSPSRLALELISRLQADTAERPPLLLAGFDRLLPVQRALFDAWGAWREIPLGEPATKMSFYEAPDTQAELAACALWCRHRLAADPRARLLIITQDANSRRGEIERALLHSTQSSGPALFEFSLGIPLSKTPLAKSAHLLLRWLSGSIAEHELDWLLSTGQTAAPEETAALQAWMRELRRRSLERPDWTFDAFVSQKPAARLLPSAWVQRMKDAQRRLAGHTSRQQSPLAWSELVPQLLQAAGWPGFRPLTSADFQTAQRWQQSLDNCGTLGFDGRRMHWQEFLSAMSRSIEETLFAPQSHDAPIQIAGPAESAALTADAAWFLGASEESWPSGGSTHPLLPVDVQRESGMPHATRESDWELASAITNRLMCSAPQVNFSYAKQGAKAESRASRLIAQYTGRPQTLPPDLTARIAGRPLAIPFDDATRIPFPPGKVGGGAGVLTAQSQCPFKAFATTRLGAENWEPAEAGLTPSQRGQLLHAVLHAIWSGPPQGLRSHHELLENSASQSAFVGDHVRRVLRSEIHDSLRERLPRRYLELEGKRLTRLVCEWLDYESSRHAFTVEATELNKTVDIAGLTLKLRLDRIDRLNDNTLLVIDYKSGEISPKCWDLPRPDDVQLPLYAGFALEPDAELGGLVFAKVRTGKLEFAGSVGDAGSALFPGLKGYSSLARKALGAEQLIDWKKYIETLARDFLAGHAEVDPREYPKTCDRCGLQTLCRVAENAAQFGAEDDSGSEEPGDE